MVFGAETRAVSWAGLGIGEEVLDGGFVRVQDVLRCCEGRSARFGGLWRGAGWNGAILPDTGRQGLL